MNTHSHTTVQQRAQRSDTPCSFTVAASIYSLTHSDQTDFISFSLLTAFITIIILLTSLLGSVSRKVSVSGDGVLAQRHYFNSAFVLYCEVNESASLPSNKLLLLSEGVRGRDTS